MSTTRNTQKTHEGGAELQQKILQATKVGLPSKQVWKAAFGRGEQHRLGPEGESVLLLPQCSAPLCHSRASDCLQHSEEILQVAYPELLGVQGLLITPLILVVIHQCAI